MWISNCFVFVLFYKLCLFCYQYKKIWRFQCVCLPARLMCNIPAPLLVVLIIPTVFTKRGTYFLHYYHDHLDIKIIPALWLYLILPVSLAYTETAAFVGLEVISERALCKIRSQPHPSSASFNSF